MVAPRPPEVRFWSQVHKTRSCWLWTGPITAYGHGTFSWPGVAYTAHRIAWILTYGPVLPGFTVCHRCRNRHCVRPTHLRLGTQADNNRDSNRYARGTAKLTHWRKRLSPKERFWPRVKKGAPEDCWIWQGAIVKDGYGTFTLNHTPIRAHRIAWILAYGAIPDGLYVCHNCPNGDNPACVNPAHLWLGSALENAQDCIQKGRKPQSWNTKLNEKLRQHIVTLHHTGLYTQKEMGDLVGLRQSTIGRVLERAGLTQKQARIRLTTIEREEICRLYKRSVSSQARLAQQFGVSQPTIWRTLQKYGVVDKPL